MNSLFSGSLGALMRKTRAGETFLYATHGWWGINYRRPTAPFVCFRLFWWYPGFWLHLLEGFVPALAKFGLSRKMLEWHARKPRRIEVNQL